MAIARYTLAVDRRIRKENEQNTDFIGCVAFGKAAEFAEKYFRQGIKIAVTGRIQTGSYVDRDGKKIYTTDVVVEDQEFAENKNSKETKNASEQQIKGAAEDADGFMHIPEGVDEELPFS